MLRKRFIVPSLSFVCAAFCGVSSGVATDVPPRSADGQTLCVTEEEQRLGEVYYVIPGVGTQLTLQTDAPLLRLLVTSNRVVGYFVAPFELENGHVPLLAGALRVPVASLTTGYEQFDAGLHSPESLGREQHPEILISFVSAGPARKVLKEDNREQCECDLVGELTIKNKTVRFESPAHIALLPFSNSTQQFSPSDLMMLRTKFNISLADLGITWSSVQGKGFTGDNANVELYFMCTTIHPKENFDPRIDEAMYIQQLAFMTQLRDFNDPIKAYVLGRKHMKAIWNDSRMLNNLALNVLTDEFVKRRDLRFVQEAAQQANELTEWKDPQYLNTLASVHYERGDLDAALKWSRKAVENLPGQPFFVGPPIRAALQEYEAEAQTRQEADKKPEENAEKKPAED